MAKGNTCPSCGKQQFHEDGAVLKCSSCDSIGWWSTPGATGGGKGRKCASCNNQTLHEVYVGKGIVINYCSACKATMIKQAPAVSTP